MTLQGEAVLARFAECKALLERSSPLSAEELAAFNSLRAKEMARAEARRVDQNPQLSLVGAK